MLDLTKIDIGSTLSTIISEDLISTQKKNMKVATDYYNKKHEIHNYRMFYQNSDGLILEEKNRSNYRIAHPFFTELVDQKVNYLLSNAIEFHTNNEDLESYLSQYMDADLQLSINDLVEGASIKGTEALYYYYDSKGKINFEIADAYNLIFLNDEFGELKQIIRHYSVKADKNGKQAQLQKAEVFAEDGIHYFVKEKYGYRRDESKPLNPQPYQVLKVGDSLYKKESPAGLPFLILDNNKHKTTDLDGIKDLIDDYDLLSSTLTNSLMDFDTPIYMVKNYKGDNLDELVNNLRTRKTVGVSDDGDLKVHTIDIPIEARREKLAITKEAIYKFGLGFDSTMESSDRAITNIGIKSRYSLLDIKANKIETRLRKLLNQMIALILTNIKELTGKEFDAQEIEIVITRTALVNDKEKAEEENLLAQAQLTRINSILNASTVLDKSLVAGLLSEELGLDSNEVLNFIQSEDYIEPLVRGNSLSGNSLTGESLTGSSTSGE